MKQVTGNMALVPEEQITDVAPQRRWYRLKNESPTAYGYFKQYLALPVPRSVGRLAKQLRMERTGLARYSADFKWLDRAADYDDYNNERQLDEKRRQRESKDLEWSARRDQQREAEWQIAQDLLDKVRMMLRVPLFKETITENLDGIDEHGRIIIRQIIVNEPLDWSPSDIAKFFEVATKMARLATGMDTDRKRIKIDVSALSDEELDELADEA